MKKILLSIFPALFILPVYAEDTWVSVEPSYRQITITGFSRARHSMILSTEVAGRVEKIHADIGDTVATDGKISCLDDTFVSIDINSVKNEIAQHQIDIHYFKKQVDRYQALVGENSAAVSKLDDFQRQLGNAQRWARIKKLEKQRLIEKQRRHCIQSPAGWQVVERHVETGQWLDIGNPVVKVGDYTKLLVPLSLSVRELRVLQKNPHDLNVWLPEYQKQVPAAIERISPAFDEQSRKIQVDLILKDNLPVYRGGLRVEVKLDLPDPNGTFLITKKAIDKRFEDVWLERKEGQTVRVKLLGEAENGQVRIASSEIKAGEQFKMLHP